MRVVVVTLRAAGPGDGPFLAEMLAVAAFWQPDGPGGSVHDVMATPELAHYVSGWPQPGDSGVVAEAGRPVGAAWLRLFPADDPGYGFLDVDTPEMSIGVAAEWRGQGVGTRLLGALITQSREAGLTALSLSVEALNDARRLYERFGFVTVERAGESLTMLMRL